jgi:hypothetical protein
MSWSDKYKRSIDCDNPQGFSQKAHCAARKKRQEGEETKSKSPFNEMHEVKSHKTVEQIAKKHRLDVSFIKKQLEMGIPIEHEHTKDKDLATDIALQHLDEIPDYYTRLKKMEASAKKEHKKFKDVSEGTLHHWFKGSKSKGGKPGWVQADGSPCANEPGETKTPKCFSSGRLRALKRKGKKGESLIAAAIRRKREKDPGQQQKTGSAKPTNVPTFAKGKKSKNYVKAEPGIKEAMELNEARKDKPGKGSGTKDACYHKVKSRYDVWPSAYASGALVKCRKVGADNWGTKTEESIIDEGQKCWPGYKKKGTKKMFGKTYNDCVKVNEEGEMIRYCPKCKKNETRQECKYGEKFWDLYSLPNFLAKDYDPNKPHPGNFPESYDHEYSMARSELSTIISAAKRLRNKMKKGEGNIEAWVQSKITKAADYIDAAADYVDSGEMKEQVADTDAMSDKKPFDVAIQKIMKKKEQMTPRQRITALKQAGKLQGIDEQQVGGSVKLKSGSGLGGGVLSYPEGKAPKKHGDKEPKLPSLQQAHYELEGDQIDEGWPFGPNTVTPKNSPSGTKSVEVGKKYPALQNGQMSNVTYDKKGNKSVKPMTGMERGVAALRMRNTGMSSMSPGMNQYESYGPENDLVEYSNWRTDFGLSEDWQKVNRQDKTDGLSPAAVKAYRRENPGSKLQTAVTEKKPTGKRAKRRASFCRRSAGQRDMHNIDCSKTPDKPICKARKRWNC